MSWRRRKQTDFNDEVESHLALEVERLKEQGMSEEEARAAARRSFGNVTRAEERIYESNRWMWFEQLRQDIRYSLRTLRKSPGFAFAAILTLALGIGANTAIFSLTYAVILRNLPVPNPGELVRYMFREEGVPDLSISGPAYEALRKHENVNRDVLAWSPADFALQENGNVIRVSGALMTGNGFRVLNLSPLLGRTFDETGDAAGGGPNGFQALVGYDYWIEHFHSDPAAIGRSLRINDRAVTVVGVLPDGFESVIAGQKADIILPMAFDEVINAPTPHFRMAGSFWLTVIGRLKPGETLKSARANLAATDALVREEADPSNMFLHGFFAPFRFGVESGRSGRSFLKVAYSKPLLALEILVGFLLLLCCANTALLVLARMSGRFREFAVRSALGAKRSRLLRQCLTEVVLLCSVGLAGGIWLGWAAAQWLVSMLAGVGNTPSLDVAPRAAILSFAAGATLISALATGLWPALRASKVDPSLDLKRDASSRSRQTSNWIVPAQVAVSVTLLVSATLLGVTFARLLLGHTGFQTHGVMMADVDLSAAKLTAAQSARDVRRIVSALASAPGVTSATLLSAPPIHNGWAAGHYFSLGAMGAVHSDMQTWPESVSPAYFTTMGTRILAGRGFLPEDATDSTVCVVSDSAAKYFFPGEDPLGRFVYSGGGDTKKDGQDLDPKNACRVVGVAEDARFLSFREPAPRMLYRVATDKDWGSQAAFAVRSSSSNAGAEAIRRAVHEVVPSAVPPTVYSFADLVEAHLRQERMLMALSACFAGIALLLTGLGLYGVLARNVAARKREMGVRLALGAKPGHAMRLVMRQALALVLSGVFLGLMIAAGTMRLMRILLFGIQPDSPLVMTGVAAFLIVVALAAGYFPARRATKVDPAEALRCE